MRTCAVLQQTAVTPLCWSYDRNLAGSHNFIFLWSHKSLILYFCFLVVYEGMWTLLGLGVDHVNLLGPCCNVFGMRCSSGKLCNESTLVMGISGQKSPIWEPVLQWFFPLLSTFTHLSLDDSTLSSQHLHLLIGLSLQLHGGLEHNPSSEPWDRCPDRSRSSRMESEAKKQGTHPRASLSSGFRSGFSTSPRLHFSLMECSCPLSLLSFYFRSCLYRLSIQVCLLPTWKGRAGKQQRLAPWHKVVFSVQTRKQRVCVSSCGNCSPCPVITDGWLLPCPVAGPSGPLFLVPCSGSHISTWNANLQPSRSGTGKSSPGGLIFNIVSFAG